MCPCDLMQRVKCPGKSMQGMKKVCSNLLLYNPDNSLQSLLVFTALPHCYVTDASRAFERRHWSGCREREGGAREGRERERERERKRERKRHTHKERERERKEKEREGEPT